LTFLNPGFKKTERELLQHASALLKGFSSYSDGQGNIKNPAT